MTADRRLARTLVLDDPVAAGLIVGVSYFLGAMVPVLPVAIGAVTYCIGLATKAIWGISVS